MSAIWVASTESKFLESKGIRPGKLVADGVTTPWGTWHAVEGDAEATACGLSVESLIEWRDQPWPQGLGTMRCRDCLVVHPL